MPPTPDDGDGPAHRFNGLRDLSVVEQSSGVYVFHTDDAREFIKTDVVVDPVKHR